MNILYITQEALDTPGPNNYMALSLLKKMSESGYSIRFIQSYKTNKKIDLPNDFKFKEQISIISIKKRKVDKNKIVKRALMDVLFYLKTVRHWIFYKSDIVFVQSTPTASIILFLLRLFFRKRILFNIYDLFPGHSQDIGVIRSKFIMKLLILVEKFSYALSSKIIVLSEDMKQSVLSSKVSIKKVSVIPPWFNSKDIHEKDRNDNYFAKKFQYDSNKFIVQFAGTIGKVLDYKIFIQTAQKLRFNSDIVFHIIGEGANKEKFENETKSLGLTNIIFFPLQPMDTISDVYSSCDVSIIPLKKGVIFAGVPSKAPILMACKRPIIQIVEKNSLYYKLGETNGIFIAIDINENTVDRVSEEILKLYNNNDYRKMIVQKAYDYANKEFSYDNSTSKFIKIIEGM